MSRLTCRWTHCEDCKILGRTTNPTDPPYLDTGWICRLYQSEDYRWRCLKCLNKFEKKERRLERKRFFKERIKSKIYAAIDDKIRKRKLLLNANRWIMRTCSRIQQNNEQAKKDHEEWMRYVRTQLEIIDENYIMTDWSEKTRGTKIY